MNQTSQIRPRARDAITTAAIQALRANPGVSMSEIAILAGVGRATLHRHFRTREELIREIQLSAIADSNAAVSSVISEGAPAIERLAAMFEAIIPLGGRYNFLSNELSSDPEIIKAYTAQLEWVRDLVTDLKAENVIADDIPTRWVTGQVDQLIWVAWQQVSSGHLAPKDAPGICMRTLLRGLAP